MRSYMTNTIYTSNTINTIDTATMKNNRVILIPAYEPDERLISLIIDMKKMTTADVVVVNDGSSAKTERFFRQIASEAFVLKHDMNLGKGFALKTGMKFIKKHYPGNAVVVTADANGKYRPEDVLAVMIRAEYETRECLVMGSRQQSKNHSEKGCVGSYVFRKIFQLISGVRLNDIQSGLRAFKVSMIPDLMKIPGERYEYESNMLLACAKQNLTILELPVGAACQDNHAIPHFRMIRDSLKIYGGLFAFSLSSFACLLLGFIMYACMLNITSGFGTMTSLLISNTMACLVSATVKFEINRNCVFVSKRRRRITAAGYAALQSSIWAAGTCILVLLVKHYEISGLWAKLFTEMILFGISCMTQKYLPFQKSRDKSRNKRRCEEKARAAFAYVRQ